MLPEQYARLLVANKRIKTVPVYTPANAQELAEIKELLDGLREKVANIAKGVKAYEPPKP